MFKKLKDKIAENSPQRIQQLTQSVTERLQQNTTTKEENFFTLGDDDTGSMSGATVDGGFTDVALHAASTPVETRSRRYSSSSMASDISFLPQYEPSSSLYHMQSDLDVSASEIEDNASMSSQLGHISKEQVYSAFQKAQMRYHKYRGRYTDIANHYKVLEKENAKIKAVLVETQDKAIRRIAELKEQCLLEQKAKAHLENIWRVELDERQIKIDTLETKIKLLKNGADSYRNSDFLVDVSDYKSADKSAVDLTLNGKPPENLDVLTKYLNEARSEIERLNGQIQELKAKAIIFNTKESDYKQKIRDLQKSLQERTSENAQICEREKENNLKLAQIKMELHLEIQNKDLEISNLKREAETLKQDLDVYEKAESKGATAKLENLQTQNAKLIDKVEVLGLKCQSYESELLKLEQYKIENSNLNEIVASLKKSNEEIASEKQETDRKLQKYAELQADYDLKVQNFERLNAEFLDLQYGCEELKEKLRNYSAVLSENNILSEQLSLLQEVLKSNELKSKENEALRSKLESLKGKLLNLEESIDEKEGLLVQIRQLEVKLNQEKLEYEEKVEKVREDAKQSLLTLETKIKEKLIKEYDEKEVKLKEEFQNKLDQLSRSENDAKSIEIKLMASEDEVKSLHEHVEALKAELETGKVKYAELENNHLDLISESSDTRQKLSALEKEIVDKENKIALAHSEVSLLQQGTLKQQQEFTKLRDESQRLHEEISQLETENSKLGSEILRLHSENPKLKVESARNGGPECGDSEDVKENSDTKLLDEELSRYKQEVSLRTDQCVVLNNEISLLQEVSSRQQNENCTLQEINRRFEGEIEHLKHENLQCASENDKLKNDIESLLQKNSACSRELARQIEHNAKLEKEVEALTQKYSAIHAELAKNIEETEKLSSLAQKCSAFAEENARLKKEIEDLLQNNLALSHNTRELEDTVSEFREQLGEKATAIAALRHQVQESSSCTEDNARLSKIIEDLQQNNTALSQNADELREELRDKENAVVTLQGTVSHLRIQIQNLSAIEDLLRQELKQSLDSKVELEAARISLMNEENNRLQIIINEKESEVSKISAEMEDLRVSVNSVTSSKQKLEDEMAQIIQENNKLHAEISEKGKELLQGAEEVKKILKEKSEVEERFNELSLQQSDILVRLTDAEQLNTKLEMEKESLIKEKAEKEDLLKKIEDYEKEVSSENEALKKHQEVIEFTYKQEKDELMKKIEDLTGYESKYQNILDENHNLKEQISQIEELRSKLNFLQNEKDLLSKSLGDLEKQRNSTVAENERLKRDLLNMKAAQEDLDIVEQDKQKLIEDITTLRAQVSEKMQENQNLKENLAKLQQVQFNHNEVLAENESIKSKQVEAANENSELQKRNHQLYLDYKQVLDENEKNISEFEAFKIKHESVEQELANFNRIRAELQAENQDLASKLQEIESELRKTQNEKSRQNSTLENTENQASTLRNRITELEEVKSKYNTLYNENKNMKTEKNNLTQLYDKISKEKKALQSQLEELEGHYNEIIHERQLLKDEIQELKISPLDFGKLELLQTDNDHQVHEKYAKEIEGLRDKLEQYKSIDKTNRASIEFYENELQKFKIKNEKLNRKLDETLVSFPVMRNDSHHDLGDSAAVLEYLRNVLFNYMIGKESLMLAKVIAAVCKFDEQQTELIIQREQQKQTLLGQLFGS